MTMVANKCTEDITRERKNCTFNVNELIDFLNGGPRKTEEKRKLENYFIDDPEIQSRIPLEYMSHKEKYEEGIRISTVLFKKVEAWLAQENDSNQMEVYDALFGGSLSSIAFREGCPLSVHYVMFIPCIMGQGTVAQQAYWINRAWNLEITCTYAQTELGHGTFIRGLETTAFYDATTEEFVINSPTLTSYKWWPGGLGHTCNYAVVVAQLYTQGKCHGIHPFVVQLRDEETHMPMPGIKIGEIGCKLGFNTVNNGYLGFDNVRIPRENMLMKNAKVLKDGTYRKSQHDKLTYGTMIFVRVAIVKGLVYSLLAKAVTIATRYSAVRRQSELKTGSEEAQILDYQTQQYKLFPVIATVYAYRFSAQWLWDIYNNVTSDLEQGELEKLPELHAMSCCLKATSTWEAATMVESCRLACGGHGYMTCSNFPNLYASVTASVTYEGETTVLLLQTARYLVKAWHQSKSGVITSDTLKYLQEKVYNHKWANNLSCVVAAYNQVAVGKIKSCVDDMDRLSKGGRSPEDAWNDTAIQLTQASQAHCRAFVVRTFVDEVKKCKVSEPLAIVLNQLCELYATYWLLNNLGDFLVYSTLKVSDVKGVEDWMNSLLAAIRPNAVGLVDGFDFSDKMLGSALGVYDGNVYERLFEEANKSPLNAKPVDDSFHKYLKPFMKSKM